MQQPQNFRSLFPIASQTSESDRRFIVAMLDLVKASKQRFSYIEVGSFLGGTLAPFLMDDMCEHVLSADERERQQPDERGARYDYHGITSQTMIDNLKKHGLSTDKLAIHDGSIETLQTHRRYDLAFIDAEHTDYAVFRDYLYVMDHMKGDSVVMFHDSSLVSKGIQNILTLTKKNSLKPGGSFSQSGGSEPPRFRFLKKRHSEMSCILFGAFAKADCASLGEEVPMDEFLLHSARYVFQQKILNQVVFEGPYTIRDPKVLKAY